MTAASQGITGASNEVEDKKVLGVDVTELDVVMVLEWGCSCIAAYYGWSRERFQACVFGGYGATLGHAWRWGGMKSKTKGTIERAKFLG